MADDIEVGLIVNGTMQFVPGDGDKFAEIARKSMIATAGSPGCAYYRIIRESERPEVFHLAEGWRDLASLELHFRRTHFQTALREVAKLRFAARDVTAYTVSGAVDLPLPPELDPSEFVD